MSTVDQLIPASFLEDITINFVFTLNDMSMVMPNKLPGLLHLYDPDNRLSAFESGRVESCSTLIFIGGLGDGLYAVPYIQPLVQALQDIDFSLTQILLSSSYTGFGFGSIDQDAKEIHKLLSYLRGIGKTHFALLGHSTGCQDIIKFFNVELDLSDPHAYEGIIAIILQAPVSDREYIIDSIGEENYKKSLEVAQKFADAGQGSEPIPSEFSDVLTDGNCAISVSRWMSLARSARDYSMGEDFFSSDLPDALMNINLSSVPKKRVAAIVLMSEKDETVPTSINKQLLLQRFVKGLTASTNPEYQHLRSISERWSTVLPGAGHRADEGKEELCSRVVGFIRALDF